MKFIVSIPFRTTKLTLISNKVSVDSLPFYFCAFLVILSLLLNLSYFVINFSIMNLGYVWFLSVLSLFLATFVKFNPSKFDKPKKIVLMIVSLIYVLIFLNSLTNLFMHNYWEGSLAEASKSLFFDTGKRIYSDIAISYPPNIHMITGYFMKILGVSINSLKLMNLLGVLSLIFIASYMLDYKFLIVLSTIFLIFNPFISENIEGLSNLYSSLFFICAHLFLKNKNYFMSFLSIIISIWTKWSFIYIPIVYAFYFIINKKIKIASLFAFAIVVLLAFHLIQEVLTPGFLNNSIYMHTVLHKMISESPANFMGIGRAPFGEFIFFVFFLVIAFYSLFAERKKAPELDLLTHSAIIGFLTYSFLFYNLLTRVFYALTVLALVVVSSRFNIKGGIKFSFNGKLKFSFRQLVFSFAIIFEFFLLANNISVYTTNYTAESLFRNSFGIFVDSVVADSSSVFSDVTSVPFWLGKKLILSGDFANFQMRALLGMLNETILINEIINERPDLIMMGTRFTGLVETQRFIVKNYYGFPVFENSAGPPNVILLFFTSQDECLSQFRKRDDYYNTLTDAHFEILSLNTVYGFNYYMPFNCTKVNLN